MHIRPDDCSVAAAVFGSLINVIVVVFPSWSVKDNQFCVPHDKVIRKSHQKLKKVNKSLTYYTFLSTPFKNGKIERKNWYCKIWVKFHPMMNMKVYKLLKSDKKLSLALLVEMHKCHKPFLGIYLPWWSLRVTSILLHLSNHLTHFL